MVQIGPLILESAYEKSMGHFDPLISRGAVWMLFIRTAFLLQPLIENQLSFQQAGY